MADMLGTIFRVILTLVLALVGLLALLLAVFSYSNHQREMAFHECQARVIEHDIPYKRAIEFTDRCMPAQGYKRLAFCRTELYPFASCYEARWVFWVE